MSSTRTTPRTRVMLALAASLAIALTGCAPSETAAPRPRTARMPHH